MPRKNSGPVESIATAVLIPGTTSLVTYGRRIWRYGLADTETGNRALYVANGDDRDLAVQLLVGSLGRALGLPVPQCFAVATDQAAFPEIKDAGGRFVFGCLASVHPSIAAFTERMDSAVELLLASKKEISNKMIVLDEWAINAQRSETAVLADPARGLQFIDHHPALDCSGDPTEQLRNWIFEITHATMTDLDRLRLHKEMQESASGVFGIDATPLRLQAGWFGGKKHTDLWHKMLEFLLERRHHLEPLFSTRLGIPNLQLPLAP